MHPIGPGGAERSDRTAFVTSVVAFSVALGVSTVALPLVALGAGYSPAAIGLLAATSAITQLLARLQLPWLLDRLADRTLIAIAGTSLAVSYALLLVSTSAPVFIASQLLQGVARALFWTATQTHAVRGGNDAVSTLARVMALSGVGTMLGPLLAGVLAGISLPAAIGAGALTAALATVASVGLHRLPAYVRADATGAGFLWRRHGVDLACWAGFAGGGWRVLLGSYVPVILTTAGMVPGLVGALIALSDAAGIVVLAAIVRLSSGRIHAALELSVVATSLALAALPAVAMSPAAVGAVLALGGAGAGTIMTLGPAVASRAVSAAEQGAAIAATGTFRAVALLTVPAAVAAVLGATGLGLAITVAGLVMGAPTLAIRHLPGLGARGHEAPSSG